MGVFGKAAGGAEISFPVTPSLVGQAKSLSIARAYKKNINRAVVIPAGWDLYYRKNDIMIELPATATPALRRVYGFVGACSEESKPRGFLTKFSLFCNILIVGRTWASCLI